MRPSHRDRPRSERHPYTITYTLTGTFSGTLDGNDFTADAVFTGVGDTNGPSTYGAPFRDLTSLKAVANGVTYTSLSTGYFYSFGAQEAGFGTLANGYFINFTGLTGYDGSTAKAPTAVEFGGAAGQAFVTDNGTAFINDASNLVFSASVAGVVPEPATWAMMIGGIGAAGGALRRRKANVSVRFA